MSSILRIWSRIVRTLLARQDFVAEHSKESFILVGIESFGKQSSDLDKRKVEF